MQSDIHPYEQAQHEADEMVSSIAVRIRKLDKFHLTIEQVEVLINVLSNKCFEASKAGFITNETKQLADISEQLDTITERI